MLSQSLIYHGFVDFLSVLDGIDVIYTICSRSLA
jgi:hypothetical protein